MLHARLMWVGLAAVMTGCTIAPLVQPPEPAPALPRPVTFQLTAAGEWHLPAETARQLKIPASISIRVNLDSTCTAISAAPPQSKYVTNLSIAVSDPTQAVPLAKTELHLTGQTNTSPGEALFSNFFHLIEDAPSLLKLTNGIPGNVDFSAAASTTRNATNPATAP